MQRPDSEFGIGLVDQHRELDLRRGDRADVDALGGERPKARAATPEWERMPTPIAETFTTSSVPFSRA